MKVIVTTSDKYHHLLPIFFKLYVREWNWPCDLVGYKKPDMILPECCTWISLGKQRGPRYFSDDLRPYFERQGKYFIWLFEDSFIKSVNISSLKWLADQCRDVWQGVKLGRMCLSTEIKNRPHVKNGQWYFADPNSLYRLSTQPSIWNRDFLLQYLRPGLDPWKFEKQPTADDWTVMSFIHDVVRHNEGTTKKDIHKLNLEGIEL